MTEHAETQLWFPPLDEGAHVVTDVVPAAEATAFQLGAKSAEFRAAYDGPTAPDVVLVAVPAGEGVAVEAAILRALRVETS